MHWLHWMVPPVAEPEKLPLGEITTHTTAISRSKTFKLLLFNCGWTIQVRLLASEVVKLFTFTS